MSKSAALVEVIGALDEANAALGLARATLREKTRNLTRNNAKDFDERLRDVQDTLFRVGADLSTPLLHPSPLASRITPDDTKTLEKKIDALDAKLPDLRKFILPGGTETATALHLARAIMRRAERSFVAAREEEELNPALGPFLNRLSSYLFALARFVNHDAGHDEKHPRYTNGESE